MRFEVMQEVYCLHLVGIGTAAHVVESMRNLPHFASVPVILRRMQELGISFYEKKGEKSSENKELYRLLRREYQWNPKEGKDTVDDEILVGILAAMRQEARRCLDEGIIGSASELDLLFLLATGIPTPARGGLLESQEKG